VDATGRIRLADEHRVRQDRAKRLERDQELIEAKV
jgi:hypothetical protein